MKKIINDVLDSLIIPELFRNCDVICDLTLFHLRSALQSRHVIPVDNRLEETLSIILPDSISQIVDAHQQPCNRRAPGLYVFKRCSEKSMLRECCENDRFIVSRLTLQPVLKFETLTLFKVSKLRTSPITLFLGHDDSNVIRISSDEALPAKTLKGEKENGE